MNCPGGAKECSPARKRWVSSLSLLWAVEGEGMGLSPSRIKNGTHGDGDFHADLLFEHSAWKIRGGWPANCGVGGVKQLQFRAETGDQLSGAEAERGFEFAPIRQAGQRSGRVEAKALDGGQQQHGVRSD